MKVAVISDTHGYIDSCIGALRKIRDIDLILHLGDYSKDVVGIRNGVEVEVINVKGNCDVYDNHTLDDRILEIMGKKIFMTHGDLYRVKHGLNDIYYRAKELGAAVALFGHSHMPTAVEHDGILFLNPGSPSLPRGGTHKSIGLLHIDEDSIRGEIIYI